MKALAILTMGTIGLIALWRPPVVVGVAFAAVGLRCLGGFLSSYDEQDDFASYRWYSVSLMSVCFYLRVFGAYD